MQGVLWCGLLTPLARPRASCAIVRKIDELCFAATRLGGREKREAVCVPICFFYFSS